MYLIQYLYENQIGYVQLFDEGKKHDAFEEIRRTITRTRSDRKIDIHKLTKVEYSKFENNTDARIYYSYILGQKMGERSTITLPEIKWVRLGPNLIKWVKAAEEKDRLEDEVLNQMGELKTWQDVKLMHKKLAKYNNFNAKSYKTQNNRK